MNSSVTSKCKHFNLMQPGRECHCFLGVPTSDSYPVGGDGRKKTWIEITKREEVDNSGACATPPTFVMGDSSGLGPGQNEGWGRWVCCSGSGERHGELTWRKLTMWQNNQTWRSKRWAGTLPQYIYFGNIFGFLQQPMQRCHIFKQWREKLNPIKWVDYHCAVFLEKVQSEIQGVFFHWYPP